MIDNRALDGFMERFTTKNCQSTDCESCRYCHEWRRARYHRSKLAREAGTDVRRLARDIEGGAFWEPYTRTVSQMVRQRWHDGGTGVKESARRLFP